MHSPVETHACPFMLLDHAGAEGQDAAALPWERSCHGRGHPPGNTAALRGDMAESTASQHPGSAFQEEAGPETETLRLMLRAFAAWRASRDSQPVDRERDWVRLEQAT